MECTVDNIVEQINQKTDEILISIKTQLANTKSATAQTSDALDTVYHCIAYDQFYFDVISHIQNEELISDKIPELYETFKSNFFNNFASSIEHFKKHFWERMNTEVFTIPNLDENISQTKPVLTTQIYTIMSTMKSWCNKNQKEGNLKGFVSYAYSDSKSLRFSESVLQNNLYKTTYEDFHETVIVYNPTKQVVFLIRIVIGKNLEDEIKLSTNDMMKFVLTFFDVLGKSGVKLINLLVTDEGLASYQLKCDSCEHQIISIKSFISSKSFDVWWEGKEQQFTVSVIHRDLSKNFSSDFLAKLGGYLSPLQFLKENHSPGKPPLHLNYSTEKVTGVLKMTPEQTRIVYLPQKHLIIKGSHGSGKTVVACKRAEIIARSMARDDSLYYIICDSRSMLKEEIQLHPEINIFHNMKQERESALVEQILDSDSKNGKINLIFDEFYADNLDETEVKQLNKTFETNKRLKDSHVIFIAQPLIMKSVVTDTIKKGNMLEMFGSMNSPEALNNNMRNPTEINRLVIATKSALEDQTMVYPNPNIMTKNSESSYHITSEIPSLYEILYTDGKVKPKILLMFVLRKVMNAIEIGNQLYISHIEDLTETKELKRLVIIHFYAENDIPHDFDIVFKLMGISERVTSKYDEFKGDPKKAVFICNYRTFRGLEHSHVIVVLDSSLCFLEHYLPECFSRCTAFLHIIVLNLVQSQTREVTIQRVVEIWKKSFDGQQPLVMPWKIEMLESFLLKRFTKTSQPVDSVTSNKIRIRIKADVYTEIKKEIDKIFTTTTEKHEEASNNPREIEIRIIGSDHQSMERDENFEPFKQRLEKASAKTSKEKASAKTSKESFKQRFESFKPRFESFEQRLEKASAKTSKESFKQRLESFKPRFDLIEEGLDWIEHGLDWIELGFDWIERHLGDSSGPSRD